MTIRKAGSGSEFGQISIAGRAGAKVGWGQITAALASSYWYLRHTKNDVNCMNIDFSVRKS